MVYLRCKGWVHGIRRYTRALADKICVLCRRAVSSGCQGLQHPRILLGDDKAFDTHEIRMSGLCRKVDHSGAPQTNMAGFSELLSRRYNAFRPRMGIWDSPHRRGGTDAQLGDDRKSWPVCRGICTEGVVCRTEIQVSSCCKRSVLCHGDIHTG